FFVPARSSITSRFHVDLASDDDTGTTIPLIAANMTPVSVRRMAEVMARRGGPAVLPRDLPAERISCILDAVNRRDRLADQPRTLTADASVGQAASRLPKRPHGLVVVVDAQHRPLGVVSEQEILGRDTCAPVGDQLSEEILTLTDSDLAA